MARDAEVRSVERCTIFRLGDAASASTKIAEVWDRSSSTTTTRARE
jgi:hypothetical protein